jgi:hypothetical protein
MSTIFWNVEPCSLECLLGLLFDTGIAFSSFTTSYPSIRLHGVTTQKTGQILFIVAIAKPSNPTRQHNHISSHSTHSSAILILYSEPFLPYGDGLRGGRPGFDSRHGMILISSTASRPAMGPTKPPIQWLLGPISPGTKRPRREADHSPSSTAAVDNDAAIPAPPPPCLHGMVLS